MLYFLAASGGALVGFLGAAAFGVGRLSEILSDLTRERDCREAIERELLDLQARAYVRNERGQMTRLLKDG